MFKQLSTVFNNVQPLSAIRTIKSPYDLQIVHFLTPNDTNYQLSTTINYQIPMFTKCGINSEPYSINQLSEPSNPHLFLEKKPPSRPLTSGIAILVTSRRIGSVPVLLAAQPASGGVAAQQVDSSPGDLMG